MDIDLSAKRFCAKSANFIGFKAKDLCAKSAESKGAKDLYTKGLYILKVCLELQIFGICIDMF